MGSGSRTSIKILEPGLRLTQSLVLVRPLGFGGMGSVWIAQHDGLHAEVVVKFMSDEVAEDSTLRERFSREAAAAASIRSPHVVQVLDHGVTEQGLPFIAMELLEGEDLRHRMLREPTLPLARIVEIVMQSAKALARAHERGVIHRDVKPDNIFLCDVPDEEIFVKLLDFGIAKQRDTSLTSVTSTGNAVGTPFYMSPEQIKGERDLDARTDVFALGVVAYELLAGRRPFDVTTLGALFVAVCTTDAPPPSRFAKDLSEPVNVWAQRALARNRTERYADTLSLARGLVEALGERVGSLVPRVTFSSSLSEPPTVRVPPPTSDQGTLPAISTGSRHAARQRKVLPIAIISLGVIGGAAVGVSFALGSRGSTTTFVNTETAAPRASSPSASSPDTAVGASSSAGLTSTTPPALSASSGRAPSPSSMTSSSQPVAILPSSATAVGKPKASGSSTPTKIPDEDGIK